MAVYTHFGAMGAVVDAVATEGFRRLIEHVDAVGRSDDTIADLRRSAAAYRDNALENRHLFGVMFGAISTGGFHGRGPDPEVATAAFDQIASAIERAMGAGALLPGDPREVAAQFWSALHGYVMLELSGLVRIVDEPERTVLWPMLAHLLRPWRLLPASPSTHELDHAENASRQDGAERHPRLPRDCRGLSTPPGGRGPIQWPMDYYARRNLFMM